MGAWPSNYDVKDVPPAEWTTATPAASDRGVFDSAGAQLPLYWADGKGVTTLDDLGDDLPRSTYYDVNGRRKQMYWEDKEPASAYNADGSQIPLYNRWEGKVTNDDPDPRYEELNQPPEPEPEPDPPTDNEPAAPVDGAALVKRFMADLTVPDDVAALAWDTALAIVGAYCRDAHVKPNGALKSGVQAVVLTVAARIAANPGQIMTRDAAGSFNRTRGEGFKGLTLTEQIVLNRYRKRATG